MLFPSEPFKIKVVEPIQKTSFEERAAIIKQAGFNVFQIPAEKIYVDLLTDSGTAAMSDNQWAGMMLGDESYAGSRNYYHFQDTIRDIFGFQHVIPTHQGRMAENLLFTVMVKKGDFVPNNIHFDTTRANVEYRGGIPLDLVIDEGLDPHSEHPFKGNIDLNKLERAISVHGVQNIPLVLITITNNSGGGQPVSLENVRQTSRLLKKYKIPLIFDACRFAENCYFIQERESGCANKSVKAIARELFACGDGCTMSAKKDGLVNIGGFLALNSAEIAENVTNLLILIEGFPTYGGLAGRDLEAISRGLQEVLNEDYLQFRIGQVRYLGQLLDDNQIPILKPVGGHAVYLNAKEFLPQIPPEQFPGQALVVALYREAGIRAVEIGSLMFAHRDPETGKMVYPELELVRLAIPRRVYTTMHINYVAESIIQIFQQREQIRGLEIKHEAPFLRHFTAELMEIES